MSALYTVGGLLIGIAALTMGFDNQIGVLFVPALICIGIAAAIEHRAP